MQAATLMGAGLYLQINGQITGIFDQLSMDASFNVKPIYTVDLLVPAELSSSLYLVQFNISGFKTNSLDFKDLFLHNLPGAATLQPYINILVVNRSNGKTVFEIPAAAVDSFRVTIQTKNIVRGDFSGYGFALKEGVQISDNSIGFPTQYGGVPQTILK